MYKAFNKMCDELDSVQMLCNDFINSYSHEFKTPIASINGFAMLLLEKDLSKEDVLIGENGAVIQFGVDLPPKEYFVAPYSPGAKRSLRLIKDMLETAAPRLKMGSSIILSTR